MRTGYSARRSPDRRLPAASIIRRSLLSTALLLAGTLLLIGTVAFAGTNPPEATLPAPIEREAARIPAADTTIALTKVAALDPDGVRRVGDTVIFTITVANDGTQSLIYLPLRDEYSATRLSFVSADPPPQITATPGLLLWTDLVGTTGLTLDPGGSASIVVTFTATASGAANNTAGIQGALFLDMPTPIDVGPAPASIVISGQPDLAIVKSDGGAHPSPGEIVTYTLTYTNHVVQDVAGIVITETVPDHTAFDSGASSEGWACQPDVSPGSVCTLAVGSLPPGASDSRYFALAVTNPLPSGVRQIANTASIGDDGATGPDMTPEDNTSSIVTPVNAAPDLQIVKSDGGAYPKPGDVLTYTLSYMNLGNQNATGVALTETVPANATFNPGVSSAGWACLPDDGAGATCSLAVGTLAANAAGSRTFAVTLDKPLPPGVRVVANTAAIGDDGTNGPDRTPGNNSSSTSTTIDGLPDLQIIKSDSGANPKPGDVLTYTLNYTNTGNGDVTGVVITETVPANTSFNAARSSAGWGCQPNNSAGSTCTVTIGAVPAGHGDSRMFAVSLVYLWPTGVRQITNTTTIGSDGANGPDPTPDNNLSSIVTPVNAGLDLVVVKSDGGATPKPGDVLTYTLRYLNVGNQGATGAVMTDTVPAGTTFDPLASSPGWSCLPDNSAASTCSISLGSLSAYAVGSKSFVVALEKPWPSGPHQVINTATIGDSGVNGPDRTPANNTSIITTTVSAVVDLLIVKSDEGESPSPGGLLDYTLTYMNTGGQSASGVVITETVPANTTFDPLASSPGWSCLPDSSAGSTCTLSLGVLPAGTLGSKSFAVTLASPWPSGSRQIANTVRIGDDGTSGFEKSMSNNSSSTYTQVNATSDLKIVKSDSGDVPGPGDILLYTLGYTNTGNQNAGGVVITEMVPANTLFDPAASTSGWGCSPDGAAGSTCTVAVGTLNAGAGAEVTFGVTVAGPLPPGASEVTNTATISDDGANGEDPTPEDNSSTCTTPVASGPEVAIVKSDGGAAPKPGDMLLYTLEYRNNSPRSAAGVLITETVPAHTTFEPGASSPGWVCLPTGSAGSICTLDIGTLAGAAGSATFAVSLNSALPAGIGHIANTVYIGDNGANGPDQDFSNNSSSSATAVNAVPDLAISKDDGGIGTAPGGIITYTLAYQNLGDQEATGAVITDVVPAYTTFLPAHSAPGWVCLPNAAAGSTCTFSIGALPAGAGSSVNYAVRVDDPLDMNVIQIQNLAFIGDDGANGPDAAIGDNSSGRITLVSPRTGMQIAALRGRRVADGVRVEWETTDESGIIWYNVYRSLSPADHGVRISGESIAAGGAPGRGGSYAWVDLAAPASSPDLYWLEVVAEGGSQWFGPIAPQWASKIFVPVAGAR